MVLGFAKLVFWMIVLGAVFVVGIGLGHQLGADEAGTDGRTLTVDGSRGEVVATLPTKTVTVTKTETVVRRVPARANPRARRGR